MKHHALKQTALFLSLTLFLSYFVFWGPLAWFHIKTVNLVEGPVGPVWAITLFIIGGFVPSLLGISLTGLFDGRQGISKLFRELLAFRYSSRLYLLSILLAAGYALSLIFLYSLLGGHFDCRQFLIQLPTLLPLIILGPLSEEFGWRGFALKRLLTRLHPVSASLIIGIIWSLWHLPLFYMTGTSQHEFQLPFLSFFITVTASSFIYTYLFIRTGQSLFSAVFFHWIYTYVLQVVGSSVTRTPLYNWFEMVPMLIIGIVFAVILSRSALTDSSSELPLRK